ncbi:MAG: hypothetical protein QW199_00550 [Candidatus Pacearchaeota archaeon]
MEINLSEDLPSGYSIIWASIPSTNYSIILQPNGYNKYEMRGLIKVMKSAIREGCYKLITENNENNESKKEATLEIKLGELTLNNRNGNGKDKNTDKNLEKYEVLLKFEYKKNEKIYLTSEQIDISCLAKNGSKTNSIYTLKLAKFEKPK